MVAPWASRRTRSRADRNTNGRIKVVLLVACCLASIVWILYVIFYDSQRSVLDLYESQSDTAEMRGRTSSASKILLGESATRKEGNETLSTDQITSNQLTVEEEKSDMKHTSLRIPSHLAEGAKETTTRHDKKQGGRTTDKKDPPPPLTVSTNIIPNVATKISTSQLSTSNQRTTTQYRLVRNDSFFDFSGDVTFDDMWEVFDCDQVFETTRPLYNATTWEYLRGIYVGVVGLSKSTIDSIHGTAFQRAIYTDQSIGKGRGVFAAEKIHQGELVWIGTLKTARFDNGNDYKRMISVVPNELACDMLQFSYIQDLGPFPGQTTIVHDNTTNDDGNNFYNLRICLDLDDGAMMNAANKPKEQNVGLVKDANNGKYLGNGQHYYATKDIAIGSELLCDYGEFAFDGWESFGL